MSLVSFCLDNPAPPINKRMSKLYLRPFGPYNRLFNNTLHSICYASLPKCLCAAHASNSSPFPRLMSTAASKKKERSEMFKMSMCAAALSKTALVGGEKRGNGRPPDKGRKPRKDESRSRRKKYNPHSEYYWRMGAQSNRVRSCITMSVRIAFQHWRLRFVHSSKSQHE